MTAEKDDRRREQQGSPDVTARKHEHADLAEPHTPGTMDTAHGKCQPLTAPRLGVVLPNRGSGPTLSATVRAAIESFEPHLCRNDALQGDQAVIACWHRRL